MAARSSGIVPAPGEATGEASWARTDEAMPATSPTRSTAAATRCDIDILPSARPATRDSGSARSTRGWQAPGALSLPASIGSRGRVGNTGDRVGYSIGLPHRGMGKL